ncbi:MAG: 2-oxo acid dehydrogenase subunit E2 [Liquorilactobacillus nagelii]|jgi:pyruvate dehydrogenase E2 component (dihydrolipoamide acetyltransferase)|uniref:2-oxo acid dehydrogenase subunit E2 n=1 Tax=Liquorilactobacillus nagelii TaxID=82688 RepID=UPI00242EAD5F|nr:2-oxo acid dehydrogenase subunit E2 [Liquorilactobacillus nagelii]MCI1922497.1 2-oxo acid dehydrogenase subunit E2 [Liquorilactobacillus nagelii]MCI1977026.1 2-oxo acid dehydrogenase subunit E2 [Liquorilactobacillus nagelii]
MGLYQFKLPDIGEGISEGTVAKWYVKVGDQLKEDDDLLEIENDKSVEEIPAPVSGTIKQILVEEGETAEVGQALVEFEVAGDVPETESQSEKNAAAAPEPEKEVKAATPASPAAVEVKPATETTVPTETAVQPRDTSLPVLAMPAVRAYAREKTVDLTQINGSGNHGQVTKTDVDQFLQNGVVQTDQNADTTKAAVPSLPASNEAWSETREKMSGIRKATAKAMIRSKQQIPHVTVFDEAVVDKLWDHRKKYKQLATDKGVHLTFLAYVVKALSLVMKEYPIFNSQVDMDSQEIVHREYINVGVATDTDRGLFVPNIKHADQLSLFDIAREISANTQKAKDGKLGGEDMKHTGMSITNIGSIGGGFFTPVINWPEVAILGLGRITKEPVVVDDQVQVAYVMKLSLSFDHRVIDGATAQRAMNRFKELLSDPELLLMEG